MQNTKVAFLCNYDLISVKNSTEMQAARFILIYTSLFELIYFHSLQKLQHRWFKSLRGFFFYQTFSKKLIFLLFHKTGEKKKISTEFTKLTSGSLPWSVLLLSLNQSFFKQNYKRGIHFAVSHLAPAGRVAHLCPALSKTLLGSAARQNIASLQDLPGPESGGNLPGEGMRKRFQDWHCRQENEEVRHSLQATWRDVILFFVFLFLTKVCVIFSLWWCIPATHCFHISVLDLSRKRSWSFIAFLIKVSTSTLGNVCCYVSSFAYCIIVGSFMQELMQFPHGGDVVFVCCFFLFLYIYIKKTHAALHVAPPSWQYTPHVSGINVADRIIRSCGC